MNEVEEKLRRFLIEAGVPSEQSEMLARKAPEDIRKIAERSSQEELEEALRKSIVKAMQYKCLDELKTYVKNMKEFPEDKFEAIVASPILEQATLKLSRHEDLEDMPLPVLMAGVISVLMMTMFTSVGHDKSATRFLLGLLLTYAEVEKEDLFPFLEH